MLQTQASIERALRRGEMSGWSAAAYVELRDKVADDAFPCTFGTIALRRGDIRFAVVDERSRPGIVDALVAALGEYAAFIASQPVVRASMQPLAILMRPRSDCATIEEYFHYGWRLLQDVHRRDASEWPDRVPRDPDDPRWSFCFGGVPFFINFKTPLHRGRRSRRTAHSYLWLVQARDGFDVVAGDTPQGRNARRIIRDKLAEYDELAVYPELAYFGTAENREWKQYFVPETNEPITRSCPFAPRDDER